MKNLLPKKRYSTTFGVDPKTNRNCASFSDKKNPQEKTCGWKLERANGLEPSTSTLARSRSSQLSYARVADWFLQSIKVFYNAALFRYVKL